MRITDYTNFCIDIVNDEGKILARQVFPYEDIRQVFEDVRKVYDKINSFSNEEIAVMREKSDELYAIRILESDDTPLDSGYIATLANKLLIPSSREYAEDMFPGETFAPFPNDGVYGVVECSSPNITVISQNYPVTVKINIDHSNRANFEGLVYFIDYGEYLMDEIDSDEHNGGNNVNTSNHKIKVDLANCNYLVDMDPEHIDAFKEIVNEMINAGNADALVEKPEVTKDDEIIEHAERMVMRFFYY